MGVREIGLVALPSSAVDSFVDVIIIFICCFGVFLLLFPAPRISERDI